MKLAAKLLLLISLMATFAVAQIQPGTFKHIIIVVMENRTPDNLFGANPGVTKMCGSDDPFEQGVDIDNGGYVKGQQQPICNISLSLTTNQDPPHQNEDWTQDYDNGSMDGFLQDIVVIGGQTTFYQYSYVPKSDVQPYFDIATDYGFANYMFQTNEGPSFEAHQFLFTGTSAPVAPYDSNNYYLDFVADNAVPDSSSGCSVPSSAPQWVDPTGTLISDPRQSPVECYTHDSLETAAVDCGSPNYCDRNYAGGWSYYAPTPEFIWTAPAAIPEVCYGENNLNDVGKSCGDPSVNGGTEWNTHVHIADVNGYSDAPIFDDLLDCKLPAISWVIPDKKWSDHSGGTGPYGPSFVGDIIDAVGGGMAGSSCNSTTNPRYWSQEPTAIFVVWDDWGGWFDHISPYQYPGVFDSPNSTSCPTNVQPNGWGCGYVYGFRVPLLVVSEYTKAGTISGYCTNNCPQNVFPYVHDFGSILAFAEYNFGMNPIDSPFYADVNALDNQPGNVPLGEFFNLLNNPRNFTSISTEKNYTYFQKYGQNNPGWVPTGPDDDSDSD